MSAPGESQQFKSSEAYTIAALYRADKAQTIKNADKISLKEPVFLRCVVVDAMSANELVRLELDTQDIVLSKALDYMDAAIGKMPGNDTKKLLGNQQGELRKKLEEHDGSVDNLLIKAKSLIEQQEGALDRIITLVAAKPNAYTRDVTVNNELNTRKKVLADLRKEVNSLLSRKETLIDTVDSQVTTVAKQAEGTKESLATLARKAASVPASTPSLKAGGGG